jgi:hypothetical protein
VEIAVLRIAEERACGEVAVDARLDRGTMGPDIPAAGLPVDLLPLEHRGEFGGARPCASESHPFALSLRVLRGFVVKRGFRARQDPTRDRVTSTRVAPTQTDGGRRDVGIFLPLILQPSYPICNHGNRIARCLYPWWMPRGWHGVCIPNGTNLSISACGLWPGTRSGSCPGSIPPCSSLRAAGALTRTTPCESAETARPLN